MGHDDDYDDPSLTGINKYFNGKTIRGRANVAIATYAGVGLLILYFTKLKPKAGAKAKCDK